MLNETELENFKRLHDALESCDRRLHGEFINGLLTPLSIYIKRSGKLNDYYEWLWDNRVLMRSQSVAFKITAYLKSKGLLKDLMWSFSPEVFDTARYFRTVTLTHTGDSERTVKIQVLKDSVSQALKELWGIESESTRLTFQLDVELSTLKKPVHRVMDGDRLLCYSDGPVFIASIF